MEGVDGEIEMSTTAKANELAQDMQHDTPNPDDEFIIIDNPYTGVVHCRERYYNSWNVANIWLVKGTEMDLIIDTGIGLWDLPAFLKKKNLIGDRRYEAVATHVHFDHAGGLHQFEDFAIHSAEADAIRSGDSFEACCFMSPYECGKKPNPKWKRKDFKLRPANPTRIVQSGDIFDLGNRQLKVVHLPGHSRGSIALFDEENGIFFSGDVIYQGPMLDYLPFSSIADNFESIETIQALAGKVKLVCPGHGDTFDGATLADITSSYIKAFGTCHDCTAACMLPIFTIVLKGRNTDEKCPKCCYYSCCCCFCS